VTDLINAFFELVGAVMVWGNVRTLLRDKHVAGVDLRVSLFYCVWGASSLAYYAQLGHWFSLAGNLGILSANCAWLWLAVRLPKGP
jgi:hypothetical protein